jgi:SPFH domain / Band 7 family
MADEQRPNAAPSEEGDALGAAPTIAAGGSARPTRERGGGGKRRRRYGLLPIIALVIVGFLLAPSVLASLQKTPRDRYGVSYGGGPIEGSHCQKIVQPGSNLFFNGLFDQLYLYPSDQQNYIISKDASQGAVKGSDSITAPTSDRVQIEYQVATFFKLNSDLLQAFHEQLGLKYRAYTNDGWNAMLQDTLRQQIESAIQQETRRHTVEELVGNADALDEVQTAIQRTIARQLIASLGREYFCGPNHAPGRPCGPITFVIKRLDIPTSVQNAYNAIAARTNEAQAIEVLCNALGGTENCNYQQILAVESGKVTFWVLPDGANVVVPGPNGTTPSSPSSSSSSGSTTTSTTTPSG